MTKKRMTLGIVSALVVVLAAGTVFWGHGWVKEAQAGHGFMGCFMGKGHGPEMRQFAFKRFNSMMTLKEDLNLTEEQKTRLHALVWDRREELMPFVESLMDKKEVLADAVLAEKPNEAAIRQASEELGAAIAEASIKVSGLAQQARTILTPQQVARLEDFREERRADMEEFKTLLDHLTPAP